MESNQIDILLDELRAKLGTLSDAIRNKLALMGTMTLDELIEAVNNCKVITEWNVEVSDVASRMTMDIPVFTIRGKIIESVDATPAAPSGGTFVEQFSRMPMGYTGMSMRGSITDSIETTTE